ncbi:MAG: hypothetical protein J6Y02_02635 [Pseudobutyrivibrio sp.]|nr:hypothetical protein [Pseudobutyrivibrio sp.]
MWKYYTKQVKNFDIVMNILEGRQLNDKIIITDKKFSAGYYIIEFNATENLTDEDSSLLRFMGCEEEVEKELSIDERMFIASVEKHMANSRLEAAQKAYAKAEKEYEKVQHEWFDHYKEES